MLIECESLSTYRKNSTLGSFIAQQLQQDPNSSPVDIYAKFLDDSAAGTLHDRVLALYHMKLGWMREMGIDPYK